MATPSTVSRISGQPDRGGPSRPDHAPPATPGCTPDERYVQSSYGPWRIDLEVRYVLTDLGRAAIR
jgi:hypothetical protein